MSIELYSGFEWRPETESQVCKSLVSISQKETETCLGQISPGPRLDHVKLLLFQINTNKMLFALLVMFSPLSISGGTRPAPRNESRNNQYFTIFTLHLHSVLSLTHNSHHKYRQRGNKFNNDFMWRGFFERI